MAGGSCNNPDREQGQNLNLTVIDIDFFNSRDYFIQEVARFVSHMKNNKLRSGYDAIRLPGERSFESLSRAREKGLALDDEKLRMLNGIAEKNSIAPLE